MSKENYFPNISEIKFAAENEFEALFECDNHKKEMQIRELRKEIINTYKSKNVTIRPYNDFTSRGKRTK